MTDAHGNALALATLIQMTGADDLADGAADARDLAHAAADALDAMGRALETARGDAADYYPAAQDLADGLALAIARPRHDLAQALERLDALALAADRTRRALDARDLADLDGIALALAETCNGDHTAPTDHGTLREVDA